MNYYYLHFGYWDDGMDVEANENWEFSTLKEALEQINKTLAEWSKAGYPTPVTVNCFSLMYGHQIPLKSEEQITKICAK